MSDSEEKKRRKQIVKDLRKKENDDALAAMPMSKSDLKGLFDYLDDALSEPCDHTRKMTEAYLKSKGIATEKVFPWLDRYGGYCDCEVLANVEGAFEGFL